MIKNLIFDMGGVVVDLCMEEAIRQFRAIGVADIHRLIGPSAHKGIFQRFENGEIDTEVFCRLLSEQTGKPISPAAVEHAWRSMVSEPPAYKLEYLLALRKKYSLYLLSNNNPLIMAWARSPDFSPAGRPITDYFDKLYLSFELKCTKPDRAIFEALLRDSGIIPSESLFIDDSAANIHAGEEVGFHPFHVRNGEDWRNALGALLAGNGESSLRDPISFK